MKPFTLSISLVILSLFSLSAQLIPFKNYSVRENLPSNAILDIKQDNQGYMWIATENGLVKFDGYNFKTYTVEDGLPSNDLKKLLLFQDNTVWVGDYEGNISYIKDGIINEIAQNNPSITGEILEIFQDAYSNFWIISGNGLFKLENNSLNPFPDTNNHLDADILCYYVDHEGKIWIATNEQGIFIINNKSGKYDVDTVHKNKIRAIIQDEKLNYWLASQEEGVILFNGKEYLSITRENGLSSDTALSILDDKRGNIIVGTYDGGLNIINKKSLQIDCLEDTRNLEAFQLYMDRYDRIIFNTLENGLVILKNKEIIHLTTDNGLADNSINCVFEDKNGNIWIGTHYGGISVYKNSVFERYITESEEGVISVNAIKTHMQKVYAGTDNTLYILNEGVVNSFSELDKLSNELYIYSIYVADNDEFWLGTIGGLTRGRNNKFKYFNDEIFLNNWYDIWANSMVAHENKIFIASEKGLIIFDGQNYSLLTEDDGLVNSDLYCIEKDMNGNLWCGSSDGLSIYTGTEFLNFNEQDGLSNNFCNDISFGKNGVAWIASDMGVTAVVLEKNNKISTRKYTKKDGLASNSVFSVIEDDNGNIWLGHNLGVDRLNPFTKEVYNYGELEGFTPMENNLGAIDIDGNGNIWFGTVEGIVKYLPGNDQIDSVPPNTYITSIKLYNDTTDISSFYTKIDSLTGLPLDLELPYKNRTLYFEYVGLHYKNVPKNRYKYRLVGIDEDWSETTSEIRTDRYLKLPNGKYTFQVMAANSDGIWTDEPVEFSFRILPPWWKTVWARVLQGILAAGLFYLVLFLRERKLRYDKKVLTQKVHERTEEIRAQKNHIEEQRDEISKQKKEITDSILYAEHIQSAILPKDNTISEFLDDYFILFKPRDIVSGDFYWIDKVEGKVIVIAADCTGHGVPGAFMSMLGVSILNQVTASKGTVTSGEILDSLRDKIISTLSHTRKDEEARDGMDIAMCIIDFNKNTLQYSGAYNPLILIRNGETEVYKPDKMPVGAAPGEPRPFTTVEIELKVGDCLYMFSDGYADQFGGPEGKKFKIAPFRKLLAELSKQPMQEQKIILNQTIEEWMKEEEQVDDILVIGIRI